MTKQILWMGTAVMATLLTLALLWQFRIVVVYVLFSLALAATIRPLVKRLSGKSLAMRLTMILLALLALGGFALLLVLSGGAVVREIQQLTGQVLVRDTWQQPAWLQGTAFQQLLDTRLPSPSELFAALIGDEGRLILPAALGFTQGFFSVISGALVVIFLSIYWSMDQILFERLWLSLLPPEQRSRMRDIWQTVESNLGSYIRSEVAQSLLAALLLGLGYWLLGSPYPILLALAGALALLIPLVGVVLVVLPPLLLGLLSSVPLSLVTAVFALIVVVSLKVWVEPRLSSRRQYNPIVTIVIVIALADANGLAGIIVAPPLSAACQILWSRLVSNRAISRAAVQVSDLKERQVQIWATIKAMDEPPRLVTSSMERLSDLIEQAEPTLQMAAE